jgi:hypothetical protein
MRFTRKENVFSSFFQCSAVVCLTSGICTGRLKVIYPKVYCPVDQCIGFAVIAECPQYTFPTETEDRYLDICFAQSSYRNCHVSIVPSDSKCCNARSSYEVSDNQRDFSYNLIDNGGIDLIHGHCSHHIKGIEVYKEKLILYGCGDFLNDYEGISGYESFRDDLRLMYFASVDPLTGKLLYLQMTPTKVKHFKVNRASEDDALILRDILNREGKKFGNYVIIGKDNTFILSWV